MINSEEKFMTLSNRLNTDLKATSKFSICIHQHINKPSNVTKSIHTLSYLFIQRILWEIHFIVNQITFKLNASKPTLENPCIADRICKQNLDSNIKPLSYIKQVQSSKLTAHFIITVLLSLFDYWLNSCTPTKTKQQIRTVNVCIIKCNMFPANSQGQSVVWLVI